MSRAFDIQNKKNLRNIQLAFAVRVHSWLSNLNFFLQNYFWYLISRDFWSRTYQNFLACVGIRTVEHTHIFPIYKQTKLSIIIIKKNAPIWRNEITFIDFT